jgi:hypothetical protein
LSGVKSKSDRLINPVDDKIAQVSDSRSTKDIAEYVVRDVDHKLGEVVCQMVANKESKDESVKS